MKEEADGRGIRQRFVASGKEQGWWHDPAPLVLGVSGGGDSMALLLMTKLFRGGTLVVAHVEHGIRGESSVEDAAFVMEAASRLQCPSIVRSIDVPTQRLGGESLEEAARRLRYACLESIRREWQSSWVLLAHQADDQAETILFNLFRGTGLRGLRGMPAVRPPFARPLLGFSGEELRLFLCRHDFPWTEDETNQDLSYSRNRIRREILPLIRKTLNPRVDSHLAALAREAESLVFRIEGEARRHLAILRCECPGVSRCWNWKATKLLDRDRICDVIRAEASSLGWPVLNRRRTEELARLIARGGRWLFQWKSNWTVASGQGLIGWGRLPCRLDSEEYVLTGSEGSLSGPFWTLQWVNPDLEALKLVPLQTVRAEIQGHERIPWWLQGGWPVVVQGSTIVWCPFFAEDSRNLTASIGNVTLSLVPSLQEELTAK